MIAWRLRDNWARAEPIKIENYVIVTIRLLIGQFYHVLVIGKVIGQLMQCARCYLDHRVYSLGQWLFCFTNFVIVVINW